MSQHRRGVRARVMVGAALTAMAVLAAACAPPTTGTSPVTAVPAHGGIRMVASKSQGFYSLPYPNEVRKYPNGTLDLRGLPGGSNNPLAGDPTPTVPFLADSITKAAAAVTDFGTNTAIYFSSTVDIDTATLPTTASGSLTASSNVMLIDLDHGFQRKPVLAVWKQTGDRFRPAKMLTLLPYPGHPLQPGTNYAAVLFKGLKNASGQPLDPAPLISQLDAAWDNTHGVDATTWAALKGQRDTVRAAVTASTSWNASDMVAFTVYRTQDTQREIDAIGARLAELPSPTLSVTSQAPCATDTSVGGNGASNSRIVANLGVPDFQVGTYPYLQSGGQVVIDGTGKAVVQRTRTVPVQVRVPCGTPPAGGWPSVAHMGEIGRSGDPDVHPPPFHYENYVFADTAAFFNGATDFALTLAGVPAADQPGLLYANFVNPAAGRANPLQQAVIQASLSRALDAFSVAGATVGATGTVGTDDGVSVLSGHGQGAATLPLVAKVTPGVEGVFSSSGTGGLYHSLSHTFQRYNLSLFTGEHAPLDELNPLVQLVQTVAEASDSINVTGAGLAPGVHYLNVTGNYDGCVALEASRHFATAMELGLARKQYPATVYGDPALDPAQITLPASANGAGGATRVQLELSGDHEQAAANRSLGTAFLASLASGVAPTVPNQTYASTFGVCGYRYDSLGGDPFGRV